MNSMIDLVFLLYDPLTYQVWDPCYRHVSDTRYYRIRFYYQSFSCRVHIRKRMGVYVTGVIGVIVFYIAVLGVGIWAAAFKRKKAAQSQDDMILANRRLGPLLGVFTLIGNYIWRFDKNMYIYKTKKINVAVAAEPLILCWWNKNYYNEISCRLLRLYMSKKSLCMWSWLGLKWPCYQY